MSMIERVEKAILTALQKEAAPSDLARAAIEACATEIDALVERRKADKRNQGNDHILATSAFLRHAALKGEAE